MPMVEKSVLMTIGAPGMNIVWQYLIKQRKYANKQTISFRSFDLGMTSGSSDPTLPPS